MKWCFLCQNKPFWQKLARFCKKWKSAKKAIYALFAGRPSIIFTSMPKVSVNKLNLQEEMRALIFSIYHCPWYCNFFTYWLCNIIDYSHCKTRLGKFTSDSSSLPVKFFQTNFCAARELKKLGSSIIKSRVKSIFIARCWSG